MPTITKSQAEKMGIPHRSLQTIEIPKKISLKFSRDWLKSNGYLWRFHRTTPNFRRFMQVNPIEDAKYWSTVDKSNGIIFVWQEY